MKTTKGISGKIPGLLFGLVCFIAVVGCKQNAQHSIGVGNCFDHIRLRIFVKPGAEYEYSSEGFYNPDNTLQTTKRIKVADKSLSPDFQNSDTRADSDKQFKPEVGSVFEREQAIERPVIGADISFVPQEEAKGKKFSDNGVEKDVLEILKDHKFNWIRLRLFVDPDAENGYSRGGGGFCGLEKTLEMAKRVEAAGMKFLLNFHYSDTWADPGKQFIPFAWKNLYGSALEGKIYSYTYETVERFIAEGVRPDMVQVGNEINNGMLWPVGKLPDGEEKVNSNQGMESFCILLRCASAAVRAADPDIPIMVHIACGGQNRESVAFFDKIISRDVKFDVIGQSYYPEYHGTLENLEFNLNDLVKRYNKPIFVVEYNQNKKAVNDIVHKIPNKMGLGTFIWEPTSPRWGGLFDHTGASNDSIDIYPELYRSYTK